ncbi:MAG: sn-glycerol-3-phosphate ABC transporter ATP-binding protein UgpC, partial [Bacteroidia bacterium]|nr:sn-glycerol-3-phosphate ABC transporter ATP-binding protein UgpC [Bacteroidia bacterium]
TFEIKDKEFLVLVGPSGCGKSTTLRMIAGLETVDEGILYINEKPMNDLPPKNRNISIVFQNYALYPHMTAYENLAFGLKIRRTPKKEIENKVKEAAAILDITDLLERKPGEMSGGQRQRVAIGRAIVRNPGVFLFDEPLSNLDAKLRGTMRSEIAKLHKKLNTTMVYVTHDQIEAMTLGDRIVVMDRGIIQQSGTPAELYNNPQNLFVAGFIGSPPMNIFEGTITQSGKLTRFIHNNHAFSIDLPTGESADRKDGSAISIGIRPESITLAPDHFGPHLEGELTFIEKLGHENYLFLEINGVKFVMRALPEECQGLSIQDKINIRVEKIFCFNPVTGKRIY